MERAFEIAWSGSVFLLGPSGPFYVIAALGLLLAALAAPFALRRSHDPLARLEQEARGGGEPPSEELRADRDKSRLEALAPYLEPSDAGQLSEQRARLLRAGFRSRSAVRVYALVRAGLTLGLVILFLLVSIIGGNPDPARMAIVAALAGLFGYFAPAWWLNRRRRAREREIRDGFPDALDLMLVCVEAGQSLDQSMVRVATELRGAHGALAEEFQIVAGEVRAGKERAQVLRDFADRAGVSDISAFVTVLVQSIAYGTSIAAAIRVYAAEMRDKRIMRAEEKANTLPTKLTLGTMLFTVPPLMLILIGPSLIEILRALANFNNR